MSFDDIHSSSLTPTLSSLSTQVWIFLFLLFHNKSSVYCQIKIRGGGGQDNPPDLISFKKTDSHSIF